MIPVRALVKSAPTIKQMVTPMRTNVTSGPPLVKISFAEKVACGIAIVSGICFIPTWVLVHLKDYQGHGKD